MYSVAERTKGYGDESSCAYLLQIRMKTLKRRKEIVLFLDSAFGVLKGYIHSINTLTEVDCT